MKGGKTSFTSFPFHTFLKLVCAAFSVYTIVCIPIILGVVKEDAVTFQDIKSSPKKSSSSSNQQLVLRIGPEPLIPETSDLCDPSNFQRKSGLFCVITGIEHTGTTMVSSLVMNVPNLYGAFELGLLMAPTTRDFRDGVVHPLFFNGITAPTTNHFWGLTVEQRIEIQQAKCIAEQYNLLRRYSPIYKYYPLTNTSWIVDKTPAYYHNLFAIMQRTPQIPFIVTQKDDDDVRISLRKRMLNDPAINIRLEDYHRELELATKYYPERLFVLNYTSLTEDPNGTMTRLFAFLGLRWDPSYLTNNDFNKKGQQFGRPPSPGFNYTRSNCKDCVTNPYGKRRRIVR